MAAQHKTMEMSEAWPDIFYEGYKHALPPFSHTPPPPLPSPPKNSKCAKRKATKAEKKTF